MVTRSTKTFTSYNGRRDKLELEYLAVYGRASIAAFHQLSTHGQKV